MTSTGGKACPAFERGRALLYEHLELVDDRAARRGDERRRPAGCPVGEVDDGLALCGLDGDSSRSGVVFTRSVAPSACGGHPSAEPTSRPGKSV